VSSELDSYNQRVIETFHANGGVVEPGLDLLLLHQIGARSGRERTTPLAYWRLDDTSVAVLASNRGAPKHPDWYHNLVANPDAKTEIGTQAFLARARVATPNERSKLLPRIAEQTLLGFRRTQPHVSRDPARHPRSANGRPRARREIGDISRRRPLDPLSTEKVSGSHRAEGPRRTPLPIRD
jgi:deazaflavin-dependent oxidoreductase (nitroreductase family)